MSRTNPRNILERAAASLAALLLTLAAVTLGPIRATAANDDADVASACGLAGGTLTTVLTPDNNLDFVVFGLYDDKGVEIAKQLIPIYSPSASAELMVTPIGFGAPVSSAKCLADSPAHRCSDPSWEVDEGIIVSLAGFVLGPDFVIATVGARYKRPESTAQLAIDGGMAGFQIDKTPVRWSAFFNSEQEVSQAFFDLSGGDHTLTMGTRDPDTGQLVPEERLCFTT
jgi:hypothetical protein